jgi:rubrerythrin
LTNSKKAFKLGVAIEDKSIQFYQACKNSIIAEDTKRELDSIISEEKKHKALFESLLEA